MVPDWTPLCLPLKDLVKIDSKWVPASVTAGASGLNHTQHCWWRSRVASRATPPGVRQEFPLSPHSHIIKVSYPPFWFLPLEEASRDTHYFNFYLSDHTWFWVPRYIPISFSGVSSLICPITFFACFPVGVATLFSLIYTHSLVPSWSALPNTVPIGHIWLLSAQNVTSVSEELTFK